MDFQSILFPFLVPVVHGALTVSKLEVPRVSLKIQILLSGVLWRCLEGTQDCARNQLCFYQL